MPLLPEAIPCFDGFESMMTTAEKALLMLLLEEAASTMQEEMKSTPLRIVTCIDPGKNRFGIAA